MYSFIKIPVKERRNLIKSALVPLLRVPVKTNFKRSTSHARAEKQPRTDAEKHLCLHVELNFNENTKSARRAWQWMMQSRTGENCGTNDHLFNLKMGMYYVHFHAIIHWWIGPECKVDYKMTYSSKMFSPWGSRMFLWTPSDVISCILYYSVIIWVHTHIILS